MFAHANLLKHISPSLVGNEVFSKVQRARDQNGTLVDVWQPRSGGLCAEMLPVSDNANFTAVVGKRTVETVKLSDLMGDDWSRDEFEQRWKEAGGRIGGW
jgi:hypothetical protein